MTIRQRQRIASTRKLRAGGCQQFASELAYLFAPFVSLGLPQANPRTVRNAGAGRCVRTTRNAVVTVVTAGAGGERGATWGELRRPRPPKDRQRPEATMGGLRPRRAASDRPERPACPRHLGGSAAPTQPRLEPARGSGTAAAYSRCPSAR
jgi:hypothetical protein